MLPAAIAPYAVPAAYGLAALSAVHGLAAGARTRLFLARALRARGTIVGFSRATREGIEADSTASSGMRGTTITIYHPEVRFLTADGTAVEFRSRHALESDASLGIPATVVYGPDAPAATAEIEGWTKQWHRTIQAALRTALLLGLAVALGWLR